jgi:beta-ureidopropionase / N-carbamoyl-L-amino-acid hydrolase
VTLTSTRAHANVNGDRLLARWETLSSFHDPNVPGWTRRPFTEWHRRARAWLTEQMRAAGLTTEVDPAGNLVGRRAGQSSELWPLILGSHTDTVTGGGRFDGMLGLLSAVEVAQCLNEAGVALRHPLEVIDYLAEEPTDFGISMVGSRGLSGSLLPEHLQRASAEGQTLGEAIESVGGSVTRIPRMARPHGSVAAALELHIEQGPRLEAARIPLAIVSAITGVTRFLVTVDGRPDHAGGTPMGSRRDALTAAAEVILAVEDLWQPGEGVATVGRLSLMPNATNVIPAQVQLWTDIRSVDQARLAEVRDRFPAMVGEIGHRRGLGIAADLLSHEDPVQIPTSIQDLLAETLDDLGVQYVRLPSFAGHDTNQLAKIGPVGMLFVPSRAGRSHCPEEWTEPDEFVLGARALLGSTLRLDAALN